MFYYNLRERFRGDLTGKVQKGLISLDFAQGKCNCNSATKIDGKCPYGGECNKSIVVYQVTCKECDSDYIGSTQQSLKGRMSGHFADVSKWYKKGVRTDSFAKHFTRHFNENPTYREIRDLCSFKILQTVNPFSFMKNVRSYECRLCLAEKSWIVKMKQAKNIINENSEIYGPCRHRAKFHRFLHSCTDESHIGDEKGKTHPAKRQKQMRTPLGEIGNRKKKNEVRIPTCIVIPEQDVSFQGKLF